MKLILKIYTVLLLLVGALFLNFTVDDAFITFRYGKNLVEHGVWNWNSSGNNLVEAYTNPLYAVLSIIPHLGNFNVLIFFKVLGVALIYLTYKVLSNNLSGIQKWLSMAFIATNMLIFPHAFSGLETIAFFLSAFYLMTLDDERLNSPGPSWMIFLSPLIRPEGALLSFYIVSSQLKNKRHISIHALAAIGLSCIYFIVRYIYFGYIFPNTFYAKTGEGAITFINNFRTDILPICGWCIAFIFILAHRGRKILPIVLLLGYMFLNLTADLQMNYSYRFAWHMLFPATFYAFYLVIRNDPVTSNVTTVGMPVLFAITVMLNFNPGIDIFSSITYYQKILKSHRALGLILSKYNDRNPILAVGDAGLIPYYSGMYTIDYVGLANTEVAHAGKEKRQPLLPTPDILIVYSRLENSCTPTEYSHAKLGVNVLMKSISSKNYGCILGPNAAGSFYLNMLVDRNFYAYDALATDMAKVKADSNIEVRTRDAIFFPGLR